MRRSLPFVLGLIFASISLTGCGTTQTTASPTTRGPAGLVWLGTYNPATSYVVTDAELGDAVDSNTLYGNIRWVVETYLNAKPSLRVILVTPEFSTSRPMEQAIANAEVAYGNSVGVPVINMFALGGVNAITSPTLLRDGIHPSDLNFSTFYGPVIAQHAMTLF